MNVFTAPPKFLARASVTAASIPKESMTALAICNASSWLSGSYFSPCAVNFFFTSGGVFSAFTMLVKTDLSGLDGADLGGSGADLGGCGSVILYAASISGSL